MKITETSQIAKKVVEAIISIKCSGENEIMKHKINNTIHTCKKTIHVT